MRTLHHLFERNKHWAQRIKAGEPGFFERLATQQTPNYLWIGCSDSRVPANQIVDLPPGEVFVHRNIGNLVVHTDFNALSVIQYAVEMLRVEHIIVCGHYGCGGVQAATREGQLGLIDNWLRHIKDVAQKHRDILDGCADDHERTERLCELNVIEQVQNIANSTIVKQAWASGSTLSVHGWIYSIKDGLIKDLGACCTAAEEVGTVYRRCISAIASRALGT